MLGLMGKEWLLQGNDGNMRRNGERRQKRERDHPGLAFVQPQCMQTSLLFLETFSPTPVPRFKGPRLKSGLTCAVYSTLGQGHKK